MLRGAMSEPPPLSRRGVLVVCIENTRDPSYELVERKKIFDQNHNKEAGGVHGREETLLSTFRGDVIPNRWYAPVWSTRSCARVGVSVCCG